MASNWAIVIGINEYLHHPERKLNYAVNDAQQMSRFLSDRAGFGTEQVIQCLGDEAHRGSSTYPTCSNLLRVLEQDFKPDRLGKIDCLWFYFSGHGVSRDGRDYLITSDCLEDKIERFALPIDEVIAALQLHKEADIVLILDACRQVLGKKNFDSPIGEETITAARERGITTIFSCDYGQYSYELEALQQGAFTYALIEGLAQHTLPHQLETYLRQRIPDLHSQHQRDRVIQTPRIRIEPATKAFHPLLPDAVTPTDIAVLVDQARDAELDEDFETAKQLWWQIIEFSQSRTQRQEARTMIDRVDRKIAQSRGNRFTLALSQKPSSLKEQIERELGLPFFDKTVELVRQRIESLSDEQIAYYVGVITTGIEERFALKSREDFSSGKSFTFWFISKGLAQLELSRQQKIIDHLQRQEFEPENGTMLAICDLIIAAGGMKGDHYYQVGDSIAPSDEGWELLDRVFRHEELTAARNSLVDKDDEISELGDLMVDEDDLNSERFGVNYYVKLRDLLKAGNWKEADQETVDRMLEVIDKVHWLTVKVKDLQKFPCQDLRNINRLWVKYSDGRFGFNIQKKIWQDCDSPTTYNEDCEIFFALVGWTGNLEDSEDSNYLDGKLSHSAPSGYLPFLFFSVLDNRDDGIELAIFSRIETCEL